MHLEVLDLIVFFAYCFLIIGIGLFVSRRKKGDLETSKDYFLADKSLPWWAIGSSLIASNISAEQFIGMSGSGFAIGLGIAAYEWMAAATLIIVAKYFLPIFIKKDIYTMPQFLELRFDTRVRTSLAIFWILLYVFVNLTSVLYLSALALNVIMGVDLVYGMIALAFFSAIYSIYGGLKAVAWTDVVQVVFLIGGGLVTTYLAVNAVGGDNGFFSGLARLYEEAPQKFDMILDKGHPSYNLLPGISVLVGGMWIANLNYWGCNQYIIQRALAAKSLKEAQRGLSFAAYLKILLPLIIVIPGIAAFTLDADIARSDEAYPWLLNNYVPYGLKGLAFAALVAAAVSSLSSMINSTSTIFTLDLYKNYFNKTASEENLVKTGRIVSGVALLIAVLVAPQLASLDQAFQFIQEYTGYISPAIVAIFLFGLFWKKATANSALWAAIVAIPVSLGLNLAFPEMPFLDRMGVAFIVLAVVIVGISLYEGKGDSPKAIDIDRRLFHTGTPFNISAIGIFAIIALLYAVFW